MQMNQRMPVKIVSRSRFRSTTDEEPSEDETPPPNRSDRPPPLPLCSSTSTIIRKLVRIRTTESAIVTADLVLPSARLLGTHGQFPVPADSHELTGIEAGPTDQGTIDGWLRHHCCDVVGLNRPAIQDTHTFGRIGAVNLGNPVTNGRDGLLRVRGGRHLTGADGPDRLVGENHARHLLGLDPAQPLDHLGTAVVDVMSRLAYFEGLPDAQDGHETPPQRGLDLGVHRGVVLAVVLPPFGVPGEHVRAAELGQHGAGHLAGVGALVVGGDVLRAVADLQLVPGHQGLHAPQGGERGEHRHLHHGEVLTLEPEGQLLHQRQRFQVVVVHLPVAGDQRLAAARPAHEESSSAARPGSVRPSRYSRLAPPPVEICVYASGGRLRCLTAAAESPPPTTVSPATWLIASASARVPAANAGNSKTPGGPFQNTVFASASLRANSSRVAGPMSSPSLPSGMSGPGTISGCASAENRSATTWSTGSTTSTPALAASE